MARGKKKEAALSPEERLEAALVPSWEQPYKIPQNWCWTHIRDVSEVVTGSTPSKANSDYYGTEFPFFKPADLDAGRYVFDASEYLSELGKQASRIIPAASTAVCCIGSIGKSGYLNREGTTNQQINSAIPKINPLYLYHYCNTELFVNQLWEKSSATTIAIVNKSKMQECVIPLAPLPEQQRIVDRIESLFTKLDEAKEKAQEALDSFEIRKAAMLQKAFSGQLTHYWREKSGITFPWKFATIGECSTLITKGASPRWQGVEYTSDITQTLFITSENVREGYLDMSKEKYIDNQINAIQKRSVLKKGDVLVNIVGASIGRSAIFDLDSRANTNQAVCLIRLKENLLNTFLCYYLNSPDALLYYNDNKVETARANISLTNISDMRISLPEVEEQAEIVRLLDAFFAKEAEAKAQVEATMEAIDLMKKSILAKAFRGELGTNDPTEESAEALLREILR